MNNPRQSDRMIALFLLALLAFSPPLLSLFGVDAFVFGVPLLYVYLFIAWAALVGLLALAVERHGPAADEPTASSANEE